MAINTTLESASTTAASNGLDRATFVQLAFGLYVGCVRLLWRVKATYRDCLAGRIDASAPTAVIATNPQEPGAVGYLGAPLVLAVEKWRGFSQIGYPIVSGVTIDVIEMHQRPTAMDVQPDKPMRFVGNAINDDIDVAGLCSVTSNSAGLVPVPCIQPMENACFVAVPKFCLQPLNS